MGEIIQLNSDYVLGMKAAKAEVASGEIYCLESALMYYEQDPADTAYQRGHQRALKDIHKYIQGRHIQ